MFSIHEIINIAIQIEENGESFYRQALEIPSDTELEALLQWLADEELRHRECFLKMRADFKRETGDGLLDHLSGTILQAAIGDHAFSLEEVDFSSIAKESELIETALGFERDSITFYELVQSLVEDPMILAHLDKIIKEEQNHVRLLQEHQKAFGETVSVE